jgi:hypothetical protein
MADDQIPGAPGDEPPPGGGGGPPGGPEPPAEPPPGFVNMTRAVQLQTIEDIRDIPEEAKDRASRRVNNLSVRDLEDLALKLQGVPIHNPKVERLTYQDLESLEELFAGYKTAKINALSQVETLGAVVELTNICDYTCCCCTPCCCCAAADVEPFAS